MSFATPYIVQLSPRTLWHLAVIILSILWFCFDLLKCVERQSRMSFNQLLNSFVLDDFLRMVYDPEDGLLACLVGGFLGGCTVYGLKLGEEDKTRLVQATLEMNYGKANSLLMAPGGCKAMLPQQIQQWLRHESHSVKAIEYDDGEHHRKTIAENDRFEEEEVSSDGSIPASPMAREPLKKPRDDGEDNNDHEDDDDSSSSSSSQDSAPMPRRLFVNPTDPVDEMVSILRRLVYSQAKPYISKIPEALLETVGWSALAMMGTHVHYRYNIRRQRHSTLGIAGNLLLAGVASGAISTVVAKRMILQGDSFSTVCREMMTRSWKTIQTKALSKDHWRSYLAMLVLLILGRRARR